MTKDNWYATNQMKLFAIRMPPALARLMNAEAAFRDLSKRAYYRSVLVAFFAHAEQTPFLASYKSADAIVLRFWMDKDIYDYIDGISKRYRVSLSSVCYTAFHTHYHKIQQGSGE